MSPAQPSKRADHAYIVGMGHFHPANIVDNKFLDELDIGSDGNWVVERTGIQSRRTVISTNDIRALRRAELSRAELRASGRYLSIADMSKPAWQMLRERCQDTDDIEALVCGTSVPDYEIPANAATVAAGLGMDCSVWDVNSACSSFVVNLHVNRAMIESGIQKKIAVVVAERYSMRTDYSDRRTAVLFGDACASALLSSELNGPGFRIIDTLVVSSPAKFELVQIPEGGYFHQNGQAVQKFAIVRTIDATKTILSRNDLQVGDLGYFVGHQANLRMLTSAATRLGLDPEKHLFNVDQYGNQGGAGAPAVLSMNWERFRHGDLVVVALVGSGLTWGAALLQFVDPKA